MVHRVVALVQPPQPPFELGCAAEVFGVRQEGRYEFVVCAERPGPVATTMGYEMVVGAGLEALDQADTIVVPGWKRRDERLPGPVREALLRAHARGTRLVSICAGAFALADTGLLDHRRATTHWAGAEQLQARYPLVEVDPDVLYIDHGDIATSAGAGAGIDLCLHLVRADFGAAYAAEVARRMVMPPHREGGQLQYAGRPALPQAESLAPLLDWVTGNLAEPLTTDALAARLNVSARTLARRFADQLGVSPGQWLLGRRIDAARALLEQTDLPVETIAQRVGLASATNLRRRFLGTLRTTPGAYRRAFNSG